MVKIKKNLYEANDAGTMTSTASLWLPTKEYIKMFFHTMKATKASAVSRGSRGSHTGHGKMTYDSGKVNAPTGNAIITDVINAMTYQVSSKDFNANDKADQLMLPVDVKGIALDKAGIVKAKKELATIRLPKFPAGLSENERLHYILELPQFSPTIPEEKVKYFRYWRFTPFIENYYVANEDAVLPIDKEDTDMYVSFKTVINNLYKKNPDNFRIQEWMRIVNSPFISKVPMVDENGESYSEGDSGIDDRLELSSAIEFYENNFFDKTGQFRGEDFAMSADTLTSLVPRGSGRSRQDVYELDAVKRTGSIADTKFEKLLYGSLPKSSASKIIQASDNSSTFEVSSNLVLQFLGSEEFGTINDNNSRNALKETTNRIFFFVKLEDDGNFIDNVTGKSPLVCMIAHANEFGYLNPGKVYNKILTKQEMSRFLGINTQVSDTEVMSKPIINLGRTTRYCVQIPKDIMQGISTISIAELKSLYGNKKPETKENPTINPIIEGLYRWDFR